MKLTHTYTTAFQSLLLHKSRSLLTITGIVIGITAIIVITSAGSGALNLITSEVTSLGADVIWIEPGREPQGPTDFTTTALSNSLKKGDIEALLDNARVSNISEIAPAISVPGSVTYGSEIYRPFIMGFSAEFLGRAFHVSAKDGVFFNELAIKNNERVAVIGSKVKTELFGNEDAVGKIIKIQDKSFRVVGVLGEKGQVLFFDMGEVVLVPYSTAQIYLRGIDYYNEVWVRVRDVSLIPVTVHDIKATLRERHNITDPEKDDFYILTQENLLDQISGIIEIITTAVSSIAAIALIVGGVGIMNIMLVSVTERTQEIGLRKALGATSRDILKQFVTESVMLTLTGGIVGVLLGGMFSWLLGVILSAQLSVNWEGTVSVTAAFIGVSVSIAIGLLFGIYPARKAAQKSPVEALRTE